MILQVDLADNVAGGHCYKDKAGQEGAAPRSRQARVGKELAGMAADLPLNVSSSVFLRVDEKQMMLWKALITGTDAYLVTCVMCLNNYHLFTDKKLCMCSMTNRAICHRYPCLEAQIATCGKDYVLVHVRNTADAL